MNGRPQPNPSLAQLEEEARLRGLVLRLKLSRPAGLAWGLRVVVARRGHRAEPGAPLLLLGELKGWAMPTHSGLRLDTLRVQGPDTTAVGPLIWAATFAWALEATPCRSARFLAIRDDARQHRRLVRYFQRLGFEPVRELGAAAWDLPARTVWGGAGLLMRGDCHEVLRRCGRRLELV